jgi:hypothetical protein
MTEAQMLQHLADLHTELVQPPVSDADRIEFLTHQLRHYRELSIRLTQQLQASRNIPESHGGRGFHRDPVGNSASARVDRQREKRI